MLARTSHRLLLLGMLAGCSHGPANSRSFSFALRAESDPGEPLAGVQLLRAGKVLATSDIAGTARFSLAGDEGRRETLQASCPAGTTVFEKELTTTLRAYREGSSPELLVRCSPNERELTVVALFEH